MGRNFAYCRVSTLDQTTENQIIEIKNSGFIIKDNRIITEQISGSTYAMKRPGFINLLNKLESGDKLVVTKLDRLGRNAIDIRNTVDHLTEIGVNVHCLALGGVDLTSASGKMTMQILSAVAEFERDLIIERTQSGLERAKKQGKKLGRRKLLSIEKINIINKRFDEGASVSLLAKEYGVSRATILRSIRSHSMRYSPDSL